MIVEGAAGYARVQWGAYFPRTRKNYAQQTASRVNDYACTFSKRQAQAIILSLLSSVLMIVINTAHKVACLFFNQMKNILKIFIYLIF